MLEDKLFELGVGLGEERAVDCLVQTSSGLQLVADCSAQIFRSVPCQQGSVVDNGRLALCDLNE